MAASHLRMLGWLVTIGSAAAAVFVGCGGDGSPSTFSDADAGDDGSSSFDATTDGTVEDVINLGDAASCPSTCAALGASCGAVTDTKCGGVVQCGSCPMGQSCGGGGVHNVCGIGNPDACVPLTCQQQAITCGGAGDGCGGTVQCGSCTLPKTCGGDPNMPGKCGCTGLCAQVPTCAPNTTTTITGTIYDPAALHPLYNALVYIPNNPNDPGLQPFAAGITCDVCGATAAGNPLVSTYTTPDGKFTLSNVPVGATIPLVVQLGRWRRQFVVNVSVSCGANAIPNATLTLPKTHLEGDIPRIGILTGGLDPVECVLRKMGVADSEFTNQGGGGHINFFKANETDPHNNGVQGFGAVINGATPGQSTLFAPSGGPGDGGTVPAINEYDLVIAECEGYPQSESAADLAALRTYAESGGRIFASDFAYAWLYQNGNFAQAATWAVNQLGGGGTASPVHIDLVSNPKGPAFDQWLEIVGVSAVGSQTVASIFPAFHNSNGVVAPTQQWLYWQTSTPMHFTFNTPVGSMPTSQCGRVVYSDWHAQSGNFTHNKTFPAECPTGAMTSQETILEFMLFDLTSCVQPYTPLCTPRTCTQQMIDCGPASDGCGNLIQCGPCPMGQTCGGNGPGKCGTSNNCMPLTCTAQGIQCGQAGDGCGNAIDCGICPTGQICGLGGPGKCGSVH